MDYGLWEGFDTSFPDRELDVVYRLQKFKQNGRRLYCSYQLDSKF